MSAKSFSRITGCLGLAVLGVFFVLQGSVAAEESQVMWVEGPKVVDVGSNLAQINLSSEYLFANGDDTRAIMSYIGNPPTDYEVGMVASKDENANWFIVFEHYPVGYIRDDDKDNIDAAAILESYRKGTEEGNEERVKQGFSPLKIVGWYEEPFYDEQTHNLTWAMLAEDNEGQVVNYNIRLLGRKGYMSAVLVADPSTLTALKPQLAGIIGNLSYKSGNRYAEFVQGDKVAKYGLTALVAGGAGAAAVKFGLFKALAKFGKAIVVAILAFIAAIWKLIRNFFGGHETVRMGQQR
ncbi:DUF2167 domain-containing protein [bacterium]|nr:MAG: DUF2167 domain-containing protein [bacterium]